MTTLRFGPRPQPRARPLVVDSFAGGGGASLGIARALGRSPDLAINHDPVALGLHARNHPETRHLTESVWDVNPEEVCDGRPVGLLWASPDCKHHSRAKGGKPLDRNVRGLCWSVVQWAARVAPEVIVLENVCEFEDYGPLGPDDRPIPARKGELFRKFLRQLRRLGYKVEHRRLCAADYGSPTIRTRLFLVARRDGRPIVWPTPSHAAVADPARPARPSWRGVHECIDWSRPCPSIFDTSARIAERYGVRAKRPLATPTLRRIARGMARYVLEPDAPFIVRTDMASGAARNGVTTSRAPLRTVTTGGSHALAMPCLVANNTNNAPRPSGLPLGTITTGGRHILAVGGLVQQGYGERPGQAPRIADATAPLGTQVARGKHAVVAAFLAQHNGGDRNEGYAGRAADRPLSTLTVRGTNQAIVTAGLAGGAGHHADLIAPFLRAHHGEVPTNANSHVEVAIEGVTYIVADIGMRMLTVRERARAQGFPDDYALGTLANGAPVTQSQQGAMIGNSVCPQVAEAIVAANAAHLAARDAAAA